MFGIWFLVCRVICLIRLRLLCLVCLSVNSSSGILMVLVVGNIVLVVWVYNLWFVKLVMSSFILFVYLVWCSLVRKFGINWVIVIW